MMRPGPLSPELGDVVGLRVVVSAMIPRGSYFLSAPEAAEPVIMCHPTQVVRLQAALEAVEIVRAGMADVLEWLGDAYPPKREPRNAPMPARHLASMLERIRAVVADYDKSEREFERVLLGRWEP